MTTIREAFDTMAWGEAPESALTAEAWLDRHKKTFGHYISGAWVEPAPTERFATINPANEAKLTMVAFLIKACVPGSKNILNSIHHSNPAVKI